MALSPSGYELRSGNAFVHSDIISEATPEKTTRKRVSYATTPPKKSARTSIELTSRAWKKKTTPNVDRFLAFLKDTSLFIRSRELFLSTLENALATRPEERSRIQHATIRALLDSLDNAKDMASIDQRRLEEDLESIASTLDEHSLMLEQEKNAQAILETELEEQRAKLDDAERRIEECTNVDTGKALHSERILALITSSASKEVKEGSEEEIKALERMLKNVGWRATQLRTLDRARKKTIAKGKLTRLQQTVLKQAQEQLSEEQGPMSMCHDMLRSNFDECRKKKLAKIDVKNQQKEIETQIGLNQKKLRFVLSSIAQLEKLNVENTDLVSSLEDELSNLKELLIAFEDAKSQLLPAIGADYLEFYSRYILN